MKTLTFVSLKIEVLSHQCLTWVLTSLRRDEMTPTETAIKNRIKEAFALKISNVLWDCIMDSIQNQPMPTLSQLGIKPTPPQSNQMSQSGANLSV